MSASRPIVILTAVALTAISAPVGAQVGIPIGGNAPSLHVELTKPFFDDPGLFTGTHLSSTMWDATAVLPLEGGRSLFARVGFSYGKMAGLGASATVSKPRFGALYSVSEGLALEAHFDLPFALEMGDYDYASGMGLFGDYEELERFQDDSWSFGAAMNAENELDPGSFVGFRLGSTLLVPTGGSADTDLFVLYSVFGHLPVEPAYLRIEISGIALVTERDLDFSSRAAFFATIMLSRPDVRFSPDLFLRVPVDENLEGIFNFAVGLRTHFGG